MPAPQLNAQPGDSIEIRRLIETEIEAFLPELARLRIEVFGEYPYLYDGSIAYEEEYLKNYAQAEHSLVVIALHHGKVVGAATGLPMRHAAEEFRIPWQAAGWDTETLFYFGESVLNKAYRGQGLGHRFFDERESHAQSLKTVTTTCFCAVDRDPADPRRPEDYRPLDAFWEKRGYRKHPSLYAELAWKEWGEAGESLKRLTFWSHNLSALK